MKKDLISGNFRIPIRLFGHIVPSLDSDFLTGSGSLNTEYNGEEQSSIINRDGR